MHFGEYEISPSLISLSPLPSVHPRIFQHPWVRSSSWCYPTFNLTKGRSLGFASTHSDYSALLRLALASAKIAPEVLNLAREWVTRRFIMQKARRHPYIIQAPTACKRTGSGTISLLCSRCFSPFPHGTSSLSVLGEYLALADGPAKFTQDSSCPALLRILLSSLKLTCTGLSPSMIVLSRTIPINPNDKCRSPITPEMHKYKSGLGYCAFARHYLRNHYCFLLLWVLRCFSSPRLPLILIWDDTASLCRVVPFGNPRINGYLHLPAAFRSLSRPSSPP